MSARPGRLPRPARVAVARLEAAYTGDDQTYAAALDHLRRVHADLPPRHRPLLDAALTRAHERINAAQHAARVRRALTDGALMPVTTLPGGVEVVEVVSEHLDQLLLTLPVPLDTDHADVRTLIDEARRALLEGHCPRCAVSVTTLAGEQLTMEHRRGCALSADAIARARRRPR